MSLIHLAITALVAGFDSVLTIDVVDGAPRQNEEDTGLFVGAREDDVSIPGRQRWPGLGHIYRDEAFEIPCQLYLKTGDDDIPTARGTLFGHLASVETWLRENVKLGLPAQNNVRAQFGENFTYHQPRTGDGLLLRVDFTVTVEGRI